MSYELWDDKGLNLIDDFDDEAEALGAVRATIARHGRRAVKNWALDHIGTQDAPLRGRALVRRARDPVPAQVANSA